MAEAATAEAQVSEAEPVAPEEALTIVEPQYRDPMVTDEVDEDPEEQQVDPTDGPGFVLNSDSYKPPPISLLEYERKDESTIDRDAIYEQADRLVKTLADYKI